MSVLAWIAVGAVVLAIPCYAAASSPRETREDRGIRPGVGLPLSPSQWVNGHIRREDIPPSVAQMTDLGGVTWFVAKGSAGPQAWNYVKSDNWGSDVVAAIYDKLHDTWVGVKKGQWIICGVKGEFYPCDDETFRETYEKIDD